MQREIAPGETVIFPIDNQASRDAIASGRLVRCQELDHYAPRDGLVAYLPVGDVSWLPGAPGVKVGV